MPEDAPLNGDAPRLGPAGSGTRVEPGQIGGYCQPQRVSACCAIRGSGCRCGEVHHEPRLRLVTDRA